jgi:hypothetical protein
MRSGMSPSPGDVVATWCGRMMPRVGMGGTVAWMRRMGLVVVVKGQPVRCLRVNVARLRGMLMAMTVLVVVREAGRADREAVT